MFFSLCDVDWRGGSTSQGVNVNSSCTDTESAQSKYELMEDTGASVDKMGAVFCRSRPRWCRSRGLVLQPSRLHKTPINRAMVRSGGSGYGFHFSLAGYSALNELV